MAENFISEEDKQYFIDRVFDRDRVLHDPYTYCIVDEAFPPKLYQEIISRLPEDKKFSWDTTKSMYKNRGRLRIGRGSSICQDPVWKELVEWLTSPEMIKKWVAKYEPELRKLYKDFDNLSFGIRGFFNRDKKGYEIGPHCDSPAKCVTMLLYFPSDSSQRQFGTTLYRPKDGHKPKNDRLHHAFKNFEEITTVEMIPNRIMEFVVTNHSWHGVKPVTENIVRNSIQLNICPSRKK